MASLTSGEYDSYERHDAAIYGVLQKHDLRSIYDLPMAKIDYLHRFLHRFMSIKST